MILLYIQLVIRIGDYALRIAKIALFAFVSLLEERSPYSPFNIPLVIEKSICNYLYNNKLLNSLSFYFTCNIIKEVISVTLRDRPL